LHEPPPLDDELAPVLLLVAEPPPPLDVDDEPPPLDVDAEPPTPPDEDADADAPVALDEEPPVSELAPPGAGLHAAAAAPSVTASAKSSDGPGRVVDEGFDMGVFGLLVQGPCRRCGP
jgi:hypothetical protein